MQQSRQNLFLQASDSPFHLQNETAYAQWKKAKLLDYPKSMAQLIVSLADPKALTALELQQLKALLIKTNMVIYELSGAAQEDKSIPEQLGLQLGIQSLDRNECADNDGFTSIQVADEGLHSLYIPYSEKGINWHTDGYYNRLSEQIYSMVLHCVRPAADGGENQLWDNDIAYMLLRDENPDYIRALMAPDAMTIPKNVLDGKLVRPDRSGPVFMITDEGRLHMRYTARARNVIWKNDQLTQAAQQTLRDILNNDSKYRFQGKLQAGQGLICNNVLHTRTTFKDDPQNPRLLYRGRYFDKIAL
ncbi:MAG: TauD/TfdA family dioxygenase [Gammaproteobacteria bacterium]|nr:TauD/TfdA family dioxygenase [Gammaproteobacteria bacterium]